MTLKYKLRMRAEGLYVTSEILDYYYDYSEFFFFWKCYTFSPLRLPGLLHVFTPTLNALINDFFSADSGKLVA